MLEQGDLDGLLALVYPVIAKIQAESGDLETAVHTLFLRARLMPTQQAFRELALAAEAADFSEYADFTQNGLAAGKEAAVRPDALREQAKGIAGYAHRLGQEKLAAVYDSWN